jgi:hypothetical protein
VQQTLFQNLAAHVIKHKTMDPLGEPGRHRTVPNNVIKNYGEVCGRLKSDYGHTRYQATSTWRRALVRTGGNFDGALTEVQFLRDVIEHHNIIQGLCGTTYRTCIGSCTVPN